MVINNEFITSLISTKYCLTLSVVQDLVYCTATFIDMQYMYIRFFFIASMVHHWPKELLIWHCTVNYDYINSLLIGIPIGTHTLTIVEPIWSMLQNVYVYVHVISPLISRA